MKLRFLHVFVVLLLFGALPVAADSKPTVIISGFSIKEGTANVGSDFTLLATLSNIEPSRCANALVTSVSAGFPFIMNGLNTFYSGNLCYPGSTTISIPLRVDPTANSGFYQLVLNSNYESATGVQFSASNTINLHVNGTPEISAQIISSNPVDIYPGDTGDVVVSFENDGTFQAQAVTAGLVAPAPLEVKWSKSFSSIGLLAPKASKTGDFIVAVPKNAEARAYPLNLVVSYLDENLILQNRTFRLTFNVKPKAQFEAQSSGFIYPNQKGRTVQFTLENTGTDTALKARVRLLPTFPFSTDGSVQYISQLAPGGSVAIKTSVDADKDAKPGTYVIDVLVDFEDSQGTKFQDTTQLSLTVRPTSLFRTVFLNFWVLWLIVIVAALLITRRRMKKKHASK